MSEVYLGTYNLWQERIPKNAVSFHGIHYKVDVVLCVSPSAIRLQITRGQRYYLSHLHIPQSTSQFQALSKFMNK